MISKIQDYHREKAAYVYLRQSTMSQVIHHRESTERQYALKDRALELGWPIERIKILDGDLGISGTQMNNREDFKTLVADVSMGKVGAVLALEASRLSRSEADWHRLLEICSLTETLIIDEDGCYNPADFNDQLLLGLKGTMSQAELHFIRARLQGGKLNKAKKGELRFPLPVGFCYDLDGKTVIDPDLEVQSAIKLVFEKFRETGSAYGVVQQFGEAGITFPKRAYGGIWKGKLVWGRLTHARVLNILKNPSYAGVYAYGRYRYKKIITPKGNISYKIEKIPYGSWQVTIRDHHEGYISWDDYFQNKEILQKNRTNSEETILNGSAREGLALLQGLLICSKCGRRITVRYKGNGGKYPTYECNWRKREGLTKKSCLSLRCEIADNAITARILDVLKPEQLSIAIKAMENLEQRENTMSNKWHMKIQRAEYDAQLAQRRYEEVDPSNRLVAATLENRWNSALLNLEEVKKQHHEHLIEEHIILTPLQKEKILAIAQNLPVLWKAPTTQAKDRKRMLRLLITDITVEKLTESGKVILHIRWQGGACEDIVCDLYPKASDKYRYSKEIIAKVSNLSKTMTDAQITADFNMEGMKSAKGKSFTVAMIKWIRYKYSIPASSLKMENELTVREVANKFAVSHHVVYYWIERGYVKTRRLTGGSPYWISIEPNKEIELKRRAHASFECNELSKTKL